MKVGMTRDERDTYEERVSIMLVELNPAGMSDNEVEAATVSIEATAMKQIEDGRQRNIDARKTKKQTGFKFK